MWLRLSICIWMYFCLNFSVRVCIQIIMHLHRCLWEWKTFCEYLCKRVYQCVFVSIESHGYAFMLNLWFRMWLCQFMNVRKKVWVAFTFVYIILLCLFLCMVLWICLFMSVPVCVFISLYACLLIWNCDVYVHIEIISNVTVRSRWRTKIILKNI